MTGYLVTPNQKQIALDSHSLTSQWYLICLDLILFSNTSSPSTHPEVETFARLVHEGLTNLMCRSGERVCVWSEAGTAQLTDHSLANQMKHSAQCIPYRTRLLRTLLRGWPEDRGCCYLEYEGDVCLAPYSCGLHLPIGQNLKHTNAMCI
jgi:hypothetical protein